MSRYFSESESESYSSSGYGGGRQGGYDERFTETETDSYSSNYGGGTRLPPPPEVPYPWRPRWDDREGRYFFTHEETGERVWSVEEVRVRTGGSGRAGGGYYEEQSTTTYGGGGGYGGGYGGQRVYENTEVVEEERETRRGGGGHGLAYGALGAVAGLAGGAFMMHEGDKMENRFEDDKYRVENDVENFPENAAEWTGRKVGEVEDIPQDIEYGVDRFDNRVEQGFDNAVNDVEYAPENMANWVGDKVGDVERFDDNVDNAYDQGRAEGRYGDDY